MKKIKLIGCLVAVSLFTTFTLPAQTNDPLLVPAKTSEFFKDASQVGKDFLAWFKDNKAYFTDTVVVEAGALYHKEKGFGVFTDVQFPIADQASVGFGIAELGGSLYTASLSAKVGTTLNIPIIKQPVYAYLESGPGYNVHKGEVIAQSFVGGITRFKISSRWSATVGAGVGSISDLPGAAYAIGASVSYRTK